MKQFFSILFIAFCFSSFSQEQPNVEQQLLSRQWVTKSDLGNKEPMVLTSKAEGKGDFWYASFLTTNKFMRCDSLTQDISDSEGGVKYARFQCDSNATYVIRGNKIKIVKNSTSYYYKMMSYPTDKNKLEKIEFSVLDSQLFYR